MKVTKTTGLIAFALCTAVLVTADIVRTASGEQATQQNGAKRIAALAARPAAPPSAPAVDRASEPLDRTHQDADATVETTAPEQGPRLALVIGNAAYAEDDAPLATPVNDARSLASELRGRGFDVDVGENLGKAAMERAIERFESKITPGATALLFYAGHGVQVGRESFLVPVSARIWKTEDIRRDGISLDRLVEQMNTRGATTKLVVVDASRRNPFERRLRGVSTGLSPMGGPEGTLVLSAVAPGKVVDDATEDNSLFARELIGHIRAPGASAESAFHRTRVSVAKASGGGQVPAVFSALVEDFVFTPRPDAPIRQSAR